MLQNRAYSLEGRIVKHFQTALLFATALVLPAAAQPTVKAGGVVNAASYAAQGLPNSAIAQGSLFTILGTGLGPSPSEQASLPLTTNLDGASVAVFSGGTEYDAYIVSAGDGQITALLPSTTPTGPATVVVTYNGGSSDPQPIQVTTSSFGIYTVNSTGSGAGVITDGNNTQYTATVSAQPGATAILTGTGLGPVTFDETNTPQENDMPDLGVLVYVAGRSADVSYRGRGTSPGQDQIIFTIPGDVPLGCNVSVTVVIGNIASNTVFLPVATADNPVCSDSNGLSSTDLQTLLGQSTYSLASVDLSRNAINIKLPVPIPGVPSLNMTTDSGSASFLRYTPGTTSGAPPVFQQASIGSCFVYTFTQNSSTFTSTGSTTGLDAGSLINVAGPAGSKQLLPAQDQLGYYSATLSSGTPPTQKLFLNPGTYAIDNGSGGADVQGFSFSMNVPAALTWKELNTIGDNPITRSAGVTVTWSGGAPGTFAYITGTSVQSSPLVTATFVCLAPVEAGTFTVGPDVLLQLPASEVISSGGFSIPTSFMGVGNSAPAVRFTAPGIDLGLATFSVTNSAGVNFQ